VNTLFPSRSCYLGIDTGATKTHALITDETGRVLAFTSAGPGNPQSLGGRARGMQALESLLAQLTREACSQAGIETGDLAAAGLGLAGFDWPSQEETFYQLTQAAGLPRATALVNDAALGIFAGTRSGWGICVAAGTSFNCRGRSPDGHTAFAIGDGMRWGEGAGALELSLKAAQAVIAQFTMAGPETRLVHLFHKAFNTQSLSELVEGIVLGRFRVTASLAPGVIELAQQDDFCAREAVLWAADCLARLAKGAIRQLGLSGKPFELVLSGSFFKAGDILLAPFKRSVLNLAPQAEIRLLDLPPVCGGVLLAMEQQRDIAEEKRAEVLKNIQIEKLAFGD
jgi:N-acetylglucosamine kinase-like BadF-type ATPase